MQNAYEYKCIPPPSASIQLAVASPNLHIHSKDPAMEDCASHFFTNTGREKNYNRDQPPSIVYLLHFLKELVINRESGNRKLIKLFLTQGPRWKQEHDKKNQ